ncbi:MAG: hypothetical protein ACPGID_05405 [Rubricella sp.]
MDKTRIALVFAAWAAFATGAAADHAIGFNAGEITLGTLHAADLEQQDLAFGQIRASFNITEHHGFQIDVAYSDFPNYDLGHIGAHAYLMPHDRARYGLFGSFADFDDNGRTILSVGGEAMFTVGEDAVVEMQLGIGNSEPDSLDFIFAEAQYQRDLSETLALRARISVTDIDETYLSATSYDLSLGLDYAVAENLVFRLGGGVMGLEGDCSEEATPYLALGFSYRFGHAAPDHVTDRLFGRIDALETFLRFGQL